MRSYIRKTNEPHNLRSGWKHGVVIPPYTAELPTAERKSWADCLNESADQDSFLAAVREHHTKEYILQYFNIRAFAQEAFNRPLNYESPYEPESFVVPAAVNDWVTEVLGEVSTVAGTSFLLSKG